MADPVRPGVNALMRKLHCSGIQTIMLTGDQSATARAVAERIGLDGRGEIEVIDGTRLEMMPAAEIAESARRAHAFSRVSPAQKLEIVRALQASGTIVAMIGAGMNDRPALR